MGVQMLLINAGVITVPLEKNDSASAISKVPSL